MINSDYFLTCFDLPLLSLMHDFKGEEKIQAMRQHTEIPIFSVCLYLGLVFYVPPLLEKREGLSFKPILMLWNLILAVFSMAGTLYTVPHLARALDQKGFTFTVCREPKDWFLDGSVGFWVWLFILSKIPELLDTAFLVLRKRRVIFLHWFHHVTVMLYCWHAYHHGIAPGLWFASMNFVVHSFMYTYYFIMATKYHHWAVPLAPILTSLQILQMAIGTYVMVHSAREFYRTQGEGCFVDPANFKMGLVMYTSYMVLFCLLFYDKYVRNARVYIKGDSCTGETETLCGVDLNSANIDTVGRFNMVYIKKNK